MSEPLLLLFVVVVSYLAAYVVFQRIARRYALVSGAEYLVLGLLLGPQLGHLLPAQALESFSPLITLGLGWIGARVGTQLALPRLVRIPAVRYRVALAEALGTVGLLGGGEYLLLRWLAVPDPEARIVAATLALVALPASAAGVRIVAAGRDARDPVVRQLEVSVGLHQVAASTGLAVLFALLHTAPTSLPRSLVPTEWVAITLAIGIVGGMLFHVFVGDETKVDRLFISLAGSIILVSGAAAALRLSPVFAALVFGMIIGNGRGNRAELIAALSRVERPFYFALLIFAGASWRPMEGSWVLPLLLFLVARPLVRLSSGWLAARVNGMTGVLGGQWGRGLIGHGGFAVVLALDYARKGGMPGGSFVFTATVASLLLTELASARFIRSVQRISGLLTADGSAERTAGAGVAAPAVAGAPVRVERVERGEHRG